MQEVSFYLSEANLQFCFLLLAKSRATAAPDSDKISDPNFKVLGNALAGTT